MSKLRRQLSANTSSSVEPKKLSDLKDRTGNLYESIAIIAKNDTSISLCNVVAGRRATLQSLDLQAGSLGRRIPSLLAMTDVNNDRRRYQPAQGNGQL